MFKVSTEKLLKNAGGQYLLLVMAFQRTHQLNSGMLPTVRIASKKNATIALQEIAEGKIRIKKREPEKQKSAA